jgi:hypothetical protein
MKNGSVSSTRMRAPVEIQAGAAANLRYIRSTIEAAHSFTSVPGTGCIAMGAVALVAAALDAATPLSAFWLALWVGAAVVAAATALVFMRIKARTQGLSLRRAVVRRFFMTLTPAFVAAAVLTAALADVVSRETIAGTWLLLYGAGIAASGAFTIRPVWVAGLAFMAVGATTLLLPEGSAPAMLALGFGGIHLALGEVVRRHHGG